MENMLLNEANRCLLCKKPNCRVNCPIDTPIPKIIELYKDGKFEEAGKILFENNPLSAVCSLVCIHEDQCLGNCVRGIKGDPIKFHAIEQEISNKYLSEIKFENLPKDKDRVAIVGGGPAGITIAFILSSRGYNVTIFDAHVKLGGVLRYGIPEYRLPKKLIDTIEEKLIELGVKIRPNTLIGPYKIHQKILRLICITGISIPSFYVATVYLDFFAVKKNLISISGNTTWSGYFSPALCLGIFCISFYVPMLLDELKKESGEDYAFYARSMGISESCVLFRHMLPRAVLGLVPSFMLNIGLCLVDAMIIEQIFSVPGFGNLIVNAVLERDSPMIHAAIFFLALILSLCYIVSDLISWKIQKDRR